MKKLILVFGLIVSFLLEFELIIYAQQTLPEWLNYTRTSEQHLLVADNSYLWIGTEGGLIRLNLSTLAQQIYTRANSSITDNEILALARDQYNNIYVSTMDFFNASYRSRLFKFDGNAWMEIGIDKDLLNFTETIKAIFVDNSNQIYLGTQYGEFASLGAILKYNGTTWSRHQLNIGHITAIIQDHENNIWIGGDNGLVVYDGSANWINYSDNLHTLFPNLILWIRGITVDTSGDVWLATSYNMSPALIRYHDQSWQLYDHSNSNLPDYESFTSIVSDKNNNLWIGLWLNGLLKFDGTTSQIFNTSNSDISSDQTISLCVDSSNTIWIGNLEGKLNKLSGGSFSTVITTSNQPSNYIRTIAVDRENNKWLGFGPFANLSLLTNQNWSIFEDIYCVDAITIDRFNNKWIGGSLGLYKYDGTNFIFYQHAFGILAVDNKGTVYGSNWEGLIKFDGMNWTVYDNSNSMLPDNMITAIAIDSLGNKWLGMNSGKVAKFDDVNWTIYDQSNSPIPGGLISALAIDRLNHVWIGVVYDAGYGPGKSSLLKFDGENWTHYNTANHGLPGGLSTIAVDSNNNIWLGFGWCSLIKFDGTAFTFYNNHNSGCPGREIFCTVVDKNDNLWLGTNNGGLTVFREGGVLVTVDNKESVRLPVHFYLAQNYPNPFNPITKIKYSLEDTRHVILKVYDLLGKELATLVNQEQGPGVYEVIFNARQLPSGVYFYRLTAGSFSETRKFTLLK